MTKVNEAAVDLSEDTPLGAPLANPGPIGKPNAMALPSSVSGLMDMRKTKNKQGLNDQVDVLHLNLWSEPDYRQIWDAVYNEQAKEGSLIADDFEAARMIREKARDEGNAYISKQKLDTIRKALGVVVRRYQMSRSERRTS